MAELLHLTRIKFGIFLTKWGEKLVGPLIDESGKMEVTVAERQMVEVLRGNKRFSLTIHQEGDDQWSIDFQPHSGDDMCVGVGSTFDHAWDDITHETLWQRLVRPT